MSFGEGATRRRTDAAAPCPCSSGEVFAACCAPILAGGEAPTTERLMRSRYTAFVVLDTAHLARTWHPATRPADLETDSSTRWLGLTVVRSAGGPGDATGIVEFRARWRAGAEAGELHETSRFARLRGRWVYVDGDTGRASRNGRSG